MGRKTDSMLEKYRRAQTSVYKIDEQQFKKKRDEKKDK